MSNQAFAIISVSKDIFNILSSLRENYFQSFTDSDLLLHILNKRKEKLKNKPQFLTYTTSEESNLTLEHSEFKKEKEINAFSNDAIMEKSISNIECKDCDKKFNSETDLLIHYDFHHKLPNQYKCSCGNNFDEIQSYIKHSFFCNNRNSLQITESKPSNKRFSLNIHDENNKRMKLSESKWRTSAMVSNECNISPINNNRSLGNIEFSRTSPNAQENNNSVDTKSKDFNNSILKFACHCQMEFEDYYQFSEHSNQCGKPQMTETAVNQIVKSSPLKIVANDDGKFDCKDCDKSFTSILSLRQHWDGMHRKDEKYICKKCGKGYRWCTSFHYHKKKCEKET